MNEEYEQIFADDCPKNGNDLKGKLVSPDIMELPSLVEFSPTFDDRGNYGDMISSSPKLSALAMQDGIGGHGGSDRVPSPMALTMTSDGNNLDSPGWLDSVMSELDGLGSPELGRRAMPNSTARVPRTWSSDINKDAAQAAVTNRELSLAHASHGVGNTASMHPMAAAAAATVSQPEVDVFGRGPTAHDKFGFGTTPIAPGVLTTSAAQGAMSTSVAPGALVAYQPTKGTMDAVDGSGELVQWQDSRGQLRPQLVGPIPDNFDDLTENQLAYIDRKKLEQLMHKAKFTEQQIKEVKLRRRKLKNRRSAKLCTSKKKMQTGQIVETNNVLMAEMQRCRTENVALKAQVEAQRTEIARLNELLAQRDD